MGNRCLSSEDRQIPRVDHCEYVDDLGQQIRLHANGWVELRRSWSDNGRTRLPARCLDVQPIPPMEVQVIDCEEATASPMRWEKILHEVPLETQIYQRLKRNK